MSERVKIYIRHAALLQAFLNVYVNALGSVNRSFPVSRNAFSVLGLMYFNFFIKKPGSGIVRFTEGVFGSVIIIFVFLPDSPLISGIRCNVAVDRKSVV